MARIGRMRFDYVRKYKRRNGVYQQEKKKQKKIQEADIKNPAIDK